MADRPLIEPGPPPTQGPPLLALVRPADFAFHDELLASLVGRLRSAGLIAEHEIDLATHCLHEALANAIVHGARGRGSLRVELHAADGRWTLAIDDGGSGFAADTVPANGAAGLSGRGRGIRIMRAFVDDLRWYRGGACAVLTRRCTGLRLMDTHS